MKKALFLFIFLFVAVFGATVYGEGNSPPESKQLVFLPVSQNQMVDLTQKSVTQPIEAGTEVVIPRCRDVQFAYSLQNFGTSFTYTGLAEFSEAAMSFTQKSVGNAELRTEVVIPRCRTVLLAFSDFFQNLKNRNVTDFTAAISPHCRDVITVS